MMVEVQVQLFEIQSGLAVEAGVVLYEKMERPIWRNACRRVRLP